MRISHYALYIGLWKDQHWFYMRMPARHLGRLERGGFHRVWEIEVGSDLAAEAAKP